MKSRRESGNRSADLWFAAGAFALALVRIAPVTAITDETFQLVRAGSGLLSASLSAYAGEPGGSGAPPLGAIVAAIGAVFPGAPDRIGHVAGALLFGGCAALLVTAASRFGGRPVGVLAVAFLVLPPAFATAFVTRPDAATGGVLLLASIVLALRGRRTGAAALAWTAALATPIAIPAAIAVHILPRGRRTLAEIATPAIAIVPVLAIAWALPPDRRIEIARAIFTGWDPGLEGMRDTADALRRVWAGGTLLAAPAIIGLVSKGPRPPASVTLPLGAAAAAALALSGPGGFAGFTATLAPATALAFAVAAGRVPDPGAPAGSPPRPVLFALLVPVAVLVFGAGKERTAQLEARERTARSAQIASFLLERRNEPGPILAEKIGALATYSERLVCRLRGGWPTGPCARPEVVVLGGGRLPESPRERRLFDEPVLLANYAPLRFRRGRTFAIEDEVWVRRAAPATGDTIPRDYVTKLLDGWRGTRSSGPAGNPESRGALAALATAAAIEPAGLGLAHESWGLALDRAGETDSAREAFRAARSDPAAIRARGHLTDLALAEGDLAVADTLLAEAFAFSRHDPDLWGTRARLNELAGYRAEAVVASERAVRLGPHDVRLLANHGSLLWASGDRAAARAMWERAEREDARILGFLGAFRRAPESAPAPPLIPLFTGAGISTTEGFVGPAAPAPEGPPDPGPDAGEE